MAGPAGQGGAEQGGAEQGWPGTRTAVGSSPTCPVMGPGVITSGSFPMSFGGGVITCGSVPDTVHDGLVGMLTEDWLVGRILPAKGVEADASGGQIDLGPDEPMGPVAIDLVRSPQDLDGSPLARPTQEDELAHGLRLGVERPDLRERETGRSGLDPDGGFLGHAVTSSSVSHDRSDPEVMALR